MGCDAAVMHFHGEEEDNIPNVYIIDTTAGALHLHFAPISLLCPSSLSPRTVSNNSVGVTYGNYFAYFATG